MNVNGQVMPLHRFRLGEHVRATYRVDPNGNRRVERLQTLGAGGQGQQGQGAAGSGQ